MNRRHYLATVALAATAGCASAGDGGDDSPSDSSTDTGGTPTGSAGEQATPPGEFDLPLSESELNRGAGKDEIPAIVDPAFGPDWQSMGTPPAGGEVGPDDKLSLRARDRVIGVAREGETRAYPLRILNFHEIVNDTFAGPLLVTFCPLCGSGVTAERRVDGEVTRFGVSGLLWNSDLVMYDERTGSLWSQILAKAVRGPKTGTSLSLVPSTITTWGEWQRAHPDTRVLLPPPQSGTISDARPRNYTYNPYGGYGESTTIGIGFNEFDDDRLHPKASVVGVSHEGSTKAYPLEAVSSAGVVNDSVGGLPVVVTASPEGSLFAYERTVDGARLTFETDGKRHLAAGGSRWERSTGRAVDGPHEGTTLTRANGRSQMFWFAWLDFHPETALYQG